VLTILEAYNAIKALDTEPDIIANACKKILGQDRKEEDDPNTIAKEIILTYCDRLNPGHFVAALAVATGIAAGVSAEDGKEPDLIVNIQDVIVEQMVKVKVSKLRKLAETDPKAAVEQLLKQLSKIME
jgi:hypothetical protein